MRFIAVILVFSVSLAGSFIYLNPQLLRGQALKLYGPVSDINTTLTWPPKLDATYPDLELTDLKGEKVRLSDFKGKFLLIEAIGMPCKACQTFSGANEVGGLNGVEPQPGLMSFEDHFEEWTGRKLENGPVQLIQIIFYGVDGRKSPKLEEAREWANHFGPQLPSDTVILFADSSLLSSATRQMIPSFQLIDLNFKLRCDAGNPPRADIFNGLLLKLRKALDQLERRMPAQS